jgi:hypothetical protein
MGRFRELLRRVPAELQDAEGRGDLYEATALGTQVGHACSLAADQPEQAQGPDRPDCRACRANFP